MGRLRILLITTILLTLSISQGPAQENYQPSLHIDIKLLEQAVPPRQRGEYILFSYSSADPVIRVGIAFQHEDYARIHSFKRNPQDVFVLPYNPPKGLERLVYRFVVDGTWMADPKNPKRIETREDIDLSYFELPEEEEEKYALQVGDSGKVTFTFRSSEAHRVSVAGSFNRWDPYMYRMRRVPGKEDLFTITLDLPEGTHYYYFVVDGRKRVDPSNPNGVVSSNGATLSVLNITG